MKSTINGAYDQPEDREKNLSAISWGLFFLWIGVAWLAGIEWGLGLLVVGIIILGTQGARKYLALDVEGFWVAIGILFLLGGIWESLNVRVGLVPIVCLLAGIALLGSTLIRRRAH